MGPQIYSRFEILSGSSVCRLAATAGGTTTARGRQSGGIQSCGVVCVWRASGDRRHNRQAVAVVQRGRFLLQVADVFIVEVKINERAQLAFVGVEMLAQ